MGRRSAALEGARLALVLAEQLPDFLDRYPDVEVTLNLASLPADQVPEGIDVTIRLGPLPDSGLIATQLGSMRRYL
jgi:DNA-binding transcriptional LysR family regulator